MCMTITCARILYSFYRIMYNIGTYTKLCSFIENHLSLTCRGETSKIPSIDRYALDLKNKFEQYPQQPSRWQ